MDHLRDHHNPEFSQTPQDLIEAKEDYGRNCSSNPTMGDIINRRFSRRGFIGGSLAVAAIATTVSPLALVAADRAHAETRPAFDFDEIEAGVDETHHVANGYDSDILLRWGDKVFADSPDFDPLKQSAAAQEKLFGYNNDYVGFIPLEGNPDHGLLVVNHEYTNAELMFPNFAHIGKKVEDGKEEDAVIMGDHTQELVDIEMAAHGGTIIEVRKVGGKWQPVLDGKFNRRLTAKTEMTVSGPAAGHDRLKTNEDPTGTKVFGTINNCAGGVTAWGTWLMAEENINNYFSGELKQDHPEYAAYERYGIPGGEFKWAAFYDRFDIAKEPNEANRFGWVVEVDPFNPSSKPVKRTALGRFKHEGCESVVNKDGRVVVYCGDDERFDYVYKFVTAGKFNPDDRAANMTLLDNGTLHVAKFSEDGTVEWMPLIHGQGPLTAENGFASQADVVVHTRLAADLLGATKMDRPEDVQPNPGTGKVYCMLTNNSKRKDEQVDKANPRAKNKFGHIIEITETDGDFASTKSTWEVLLKCGDPDVAEVGASFSTATTKNGWFGMPDNCAIDADGRLWVATDGNNEKATGRTDGIWAVETEGEMRGTSKLFFRVPVGAEMCGPCFNPTSDTFFVAVQHPGDAGLPTFETPATRWPDFKDGMPPRPSVVAITKAGGGKIA
ncbi:PhoX family phosphatase [Rhizobium sp. KVB221]|uniref:PhoX family phosphatase n=1 Tax=Rhizobium setariae TaxID=2801340 RepID=A0A937CM61_9HYPH|nr:PhoX family phosphatase [Rhizobium setariae]MBL0370569.1 PhoX family phosphatase [Rhizobium setariae]